MKPICIICNKKSDFLMKKEEFDIYRCSSCTLVFIHPQLSPNFLKEEIYSYKSGYQAGKNHDLTRLFPDRNQQKILNFFEKQKRGSVLDIGCSIGSMMYFLRKKGFNPQGVELNARTAMIAERNGFTVFRDFLEKANFSPKSFDYIFIGDIIEHVNDPRNFLSLCRGFLKESGKIIIVTPNLDCFWSCSGFWLWKTFAIPWSSITPPHHLFQFSTDNLVQLMKQEGIKSFNIWYNPSPRLKYELGSLHLFRAFKRRKTLVSFIKLVFGFTLYIILYGIYKIVRVFLQRDNGIVIVGQV